MAYDLILIGGTGQRLGVVLGWLGVLGLAEAPRRVLIVDAEGNPDYPSAVSTRLQALFNFAGGGLAYCKRVSPFRQEAPTPQRELDNPSDDLWRLCFTEEETELRIALGFMANPKVAATVFTRRFQHEGGQIIREFLPPPAERVPVLLIGSMAGGTGAGLLYALAQACRERIPSGTARAPILGLAFANYLTVEDAATRAQLDSNSRCGAQFLWSRWAQRDGFPFDSLVLCGPPVSAPGVTVRRDEVDVHRFPGFLLGAALFADGCRRRMAAVQASLAHPDDPAQAGAPDPSLVLVGVRREDAGVYLRGPDVRLPCARTASEVCADDLMPLLGVVAREFGELAGLRWEEAVRWDSLFPKSKLSWALWESLRAQEPDGRVRRSLVRQFFQTLQGADRRSGLLGTVAGWLLSARPGGGIALLDWLRSLSTQGLLAEPGPHSVRVREQSWRKSIQIHTPVEGVTGQERLAQVVVQDLCTGPIRPVEPEGAVASNLQWAFPYELTFKPAELGPTSVSRSASPPVFLTAAALQHAATGACFPTPLGRAYSFRAQLEAELAASTKTAFWESVRALWYGLALGWLELDPIDLRDHRASPFLNVVSFLEQRSAVAVVRTTRQLFRVPPGTPIGATDPECGLWSGVRFSAQDGDPIGQALSAIAAAASEGAPRDLAAGVLCAWLRDLQDLPALSTNFEPAWLRAVTVLTSGATPVARSELATSGPCPLRLPGVGVEPVYLYRSDPQRQIRRTILIDQLQHKRLRFTEARDGSAEHALLDDGHPVAFLRGVKRAGAALDVPAQEGRGVLHLALGEDLMVGKRPSGGGPIDDLLPDGELRRVARWLRERSDSRVRLPDVLWPSEPRGSAR